MNMAEKIWIIDHKTKPSNTYSNATSNQDIHLNQTNLFMECMLLENTYKLSHTTHKEAMDLNLMGLFQTTLASYTTS